MWYVDELPLHTWSGLIIAITSWTVRFTQRFESTKTWYSLKVGYCVQCVQSVNAFVHALHYHIRLMHTHSRVWHAEDVIREQLICFLIEIPLREFPFQMEFSEKHGIPNNNTNRIVQRIPFEKEIPSGGSQAGNMLQTSCPMWGQAVDRADAVRGPGLPPVRSDDDDYYYYYYYC